MAKWNLEPATLMDASKTETVQQIINRLRRKAEIMRLDQKASGSNRYHDTNEMLTLIDMLERNLGIKND
jgi:hypothetical protein